MAYTAQQVLDRVQIVLQDAGNVRWSAAELLMWLNDGRQEACIHRPDLYATPFIVSLAGGTRQTIPADGSRLLDVVCNVENDGATRGRAVRVIDRATLDRIRPGWHTEAAAAAIKHFMFSESAPRLFYVYPPAVLNTKIELIYAQIPAVISVLSTELTPEGEYALAIVDYVAYRAYSKDAEVPGNMTRAAAHYELFKNLLTEGDARDVPASPNTSRHDGKPQRGG